MKWNRLVKKKETQKENGNKALALRNMSYQFIQLMNTGKDTSLKSATAELVREAFGYPETNKPTEDNHMSEKLQLKITQQLSLSEEEAAMETADYVGPQVAMLQWKVHCLKPAQHGKS